MGMMRLGDRDANAELVNLMYNAVVFGFEPFKPRDTELKLYYSYDRLTWRIDVLSSGLIKPVIVYINQYDLVRAYDIDAYCLEKAVDMANLIRYRSGVETSDNHVLGEN